MNVRTSTQTSSSERAIAAVFVACITFVVGYSATRTYLSRPVDPRTGTPSTVVPHQAELWKGLGE
ncbi:MAG: hypothetical protein AAFX40_07900 [Cyanobacteria bacterium J06639_1]